MQKLIRFPLTRIILATILLLFAITAAQFGMIGIGRVLGLNLGLTSLLSGLAVAPVSLIIYRAYVRLIEARPLSELSPEGALAELGVGLLLGAGLFTAVIGVIWLLGSYRVTGFNGVEVLLAPLAVAVASGFGEEIIFRGVIFRITEESLGTWWALGISGLIFGLLHLGNPNATLWGGIAIALEAGILLAAAYMLTRRLWLAIGLHAAWNFTQGGIFGVNVSGFEFRGLLQSQLTGPELLSGGKLGAEGSVVAVLVCLAAGIYLIVRAVQKGHVVLPYWKRKAS
jgi:membrane protease YdiL (CAAX protease family)